MKLFRRFCLFVFLGCLSNLAIIGYLSLRYSVWFWLLFIAQFIGCYAGAEILHTIYSKPKMPHPTSLAFQKEVLERYKI